MIYNQATEAINMTYLDAKSIVFPIEFFLSNIDRAIKTIDMLIVENCKCIILDTPLVANIRYKHQEHRYSISYVVGPGSIICNTGCKVSSDVELAEKCWISGVYVSTRSKCTVYIPSSSYLNFLERRLSNLDQVPSLDIYFDSVQRRGEKGIAILHTSLEAEEGKTQGKLYSWDPLHPAGAIGKLGTEIEVKKYYTLLGHLARLEQYILTVDGSPLVGEIKGLGRGLIFHYDPLYEADILLLVAYLGTLYECGEHQR